MTPYRKLEPFNSNIFMIYNHGQFKMPIRLLNLYLGAKGGLNIARCPWGQCSTCRYNGKWFQYPPIKLGYKFTGK